MEQKIATTSHKIPIGIDLGVNIAISYIQLRKNKFLRNCKMA